MKPDLLYEIFPRDFGPSGTFRDIEARLDYILHEVGIDTIWLMPIHPTGKRKRKGPLGSPYAVRDFRGIDPAFGTEDDLRSLVDAVHRRGMRILLDLVPNHCAVDNPWVRRYPEWIRRDGHRRPLAPDPHWNDVYALNYADRGLCREMESVMRYWLDQFGIDGYRVDACDRVPNEFWKRTIARLRKDYPELILLAEAETAWWQELGFDMSYDGDLRTAMWQVFRDGQSVARIIEHLRARAGRRQDDLAFLRFTENHDIPRTRDAFPAAMDRAAAALVFTLPGVPLIYAGQEIGLADRPDFFTRSPLAWSRTDLSVSRMYRRLIDMRKSHPALRHGRMRLVKNNHPDDVLSFTRKAAGEHLLVTVNVRNRPVTGVRLACSRTPSAEAEAWNPLSGRRAAIGPGQVTLPSLPPYGVRLIRIGQQAYASAGRTSPS